ncbi:MAG: malto-oligosyltrehalose synthase [Dehalococcoidales bacterium]|nr:MAG: malto-oligosyltrehalose synthase [Dehalococcoidales bacterium]
MSEFRIPIATYRLQLNGQFRFKDARVLIRYLRRLGISDLYASPILKAREGSSHGYDVTDPTHLNPELGTEADFDALAQELKNHNMGLLLDIVPNHMAASHENPWWQDFLDKGQASPYAGFFDTDWLSFGETEGETAGYRRFFDIGDLVGIRAENPDVFEAVHSLILRLINENKITGLRIDHIDGLYDPSKYLSQLQNRINPQVDKTGFYIVVEKILSGNESLPEEWPVSGTTGYDFANTLNNLFVDGDGLRSLDGIYSRFTGEQVEFAAIVYDKKKQVMDELFPEEMKALGNHLTCLVNKPGHTPQLSPEKATELLTEITAYLPVYRTYIQNREITSRDRGYLEHAFREAKQIAGVTDNGIPDFLRRVFFLDFPADFSAEDEESWLQFVLRWQQLTGAVMAKGYEDTALYCYNRLVSLNEVGSEPDSLGLSIDDFHHCVLARQERWPHTLNATSTHDTKRSEDVRARINVLSEIPKEWENHITQWRRWNKPKKPLVNGLLVPEPNTEILLYQTLIGAWPLHENEVPGFKQRLKAYMIKAVREAKVLTNWLSPDLEYESTLIRFLDSILDNTKKGDGFLDDFMIFEKQIAYYGALNSLAQVLLKLTSPGIPDLYQGTELWDFSLVDPDNRRPVNFKTRAMLLDELTQCEGKGQEIPIQQLLDSWQDGRVKLYVTYKGLNVRRTYSETFQEGKYIPLQITGYKQKHVCAFARCRGEEYALVIIPRLFTKLVRAGMIPVGQEVWGEDLLLLPNSVPDQWLNVFTGEKLKVSNTQWSLRISDVLARFPVALLISS